MRDDDDTPFEVSLKLPKNHAFTARLRPSTVRQTALMLLPWALWFVLPAGRLRMMALFVASRVSPLARPRIRGL